jgi:uncharacterized membrane protein YkvA (DUF1232 family)
VDQAEHRTVLAKLKQRARALKGEIHALYFAARDPRTPWYAKAMIAGVVAYALSPIDLIPDFVPLLGYLDDLLLLPIGIYLALKLVPAEVLSDARRHAAETAGNLPKRHTAAFIIVLVWLLMALTIAVIIARSFGIEAQVLTAG